MTRFLPYAVLLAEVLLFYRKPLFVAGYLIPWDLPGYNLPLATYISQCLRRGELPLWDPYTYCGFPFFANLQAQLWYPPTLLAILLSGFATGARLLAALEWQIAAHVFLAGLGTYWLLRRLGTGRAAATLGATVFQLGAYFTSVAALGAPNTAAWMPLAWLAVVALRDGFDRRWMALLAGSLAMSILAGFPAVTAVVIGSTLLLALALSPRLLGWGLLACIWAGLLAAIQLLPTWQLVGFSEAMGRGAADAMSGSPLRGLITLVAPNHFHELDMKGYQLEGNPAFAYFYCGIPALLLVWFARRNRVTAAFALVAGAALLWTLGSSTPVGPWLYRLLPQPIRAPLYMEYTKAAFVLGLAVLAGLGADAFPFFRRRWVAAALVALTAVDLIAVGSGRALNTARIADSPLVTPVEFEGAAETLTKLRKLTDQATPPWRVEAIADSMAWAANPMVTRIPTAHGNDPLCPARLLAVRRLFCKGNPWERYCEADALQSPIVRLLNTRYAVSWGTEPPPAVRNAGWSEAADLPGHKVWEAPGVLPRFFLAGRVISTSEPLAVLRSFDPATTAIIEEPASFEGAPIPPDRVQVLQYRPREVVLEADAPAKAWLVTTETFYPGWKAWLDGVEVPLVRTNAAFRGLPVPAGRHRIQMRFEPAILWYGAALSALAWLALAAALSTRRRPPA